VCGRKKKDIIELLLLATSYYYPFQICPAFSILLECVYNSLCRKPDESRDLFLFICSVLFVTRYYGALIPLSTMGKRPAYAVSLHLFPRLGRFRIDGHQRQFPPNDASRKGTHTHTNNKKKKKKKPRAKWASESGNMMKNLIGAVRAHPALFPAIGSHPAAAPLFM
jgi:hypothetical protein